MVERKLVAVPAIYKTWRYPFVKAWKKMFGCNHQHLFFVTDYYDGKEYKCSDFKCDACGVTMGVGPE